MHYETLPLGKTIDTLNSTEPLKQIAQDKGTAQMLDYIQVIREELKKFAWTELIPPSYSPDLAPSDDHLFRFRFSERVQISLITIIRLKTLKKNFYTGQDYNSTTEIAENHQ